MNSATLDRPLASSSSRARVPITVAFGDGIGPEIMRATLKILARAGAAIQLEEIELGKRVYNRGFTAGIEPYAWDSIRRTGVLLKAPITTPQGGGYKSLNVTIRKSLGLFANVRPATSFAPFVASPSSRVNMVIVRENEEDLYAGIEHRQTQDVYQCLKLVSRPGCERISRYAFEYARAHGRRKVTCMSKDNIMKLTDGLFHRVFDEIGAEYPEIVREHRIIDIGMARAATRPEDFDVVVVPNLYGDILSDVVAEVASSVGMAPSANIGQKCAMFEAIHGAAPDIAGQGIANPSGLIRAAIMMLAHIGQPDVAERIENAWLRTIEDGIHTPDIFREEVSRQRVGTMEFADAVIERLGQTPLHLVPAEYGASGPIVLPEPAPRPNAKKEYVGVDAFVSWTGDADSLANFLGTQQEGFELNMITNRGVKVWPEGLPETFTTDHWRCRFLANGTVTPHEIARLVADLTQGGADVVKTESLCTFDGEPGFSLGQGQ